MRGLVIIWYVMDSLRPDFLSCYGHRKETSPNIDKLAHEGVCFTSAFAQTTWTKPSGASMLSSTYPSVHGANGMGDVVPSYLPMVQDLLRRAGFKTVAVSSMGNISPYFGFGKGFDVFVELYKEKRVMEKRRKVIIRNPQWTPHFGEAGDRVPIATSEDINDYVFPLLKEYGDKPLFIFIWSLDTHGPYFHRDMDFARFHPYDDLKLSDEIQRAQSQAEIDLLRGLYEDMIYYNDHHIGILVDMMKELRLYDHSLLILTGDHGEAFGEHGVTSHGKIPHDEQIRVPLIVKFPYSEHSGKVSSIVQHIDIVPTLLNYLGITDGSMLIQGKNVMPALRNQQKVNEYAFVEYLHRDFPSYVALRTEDHKLMAVRRPEITFRKWLRERKKLWPSPWFVYKPLYLFDVKNDPGESDNIIEKNKAVARQFHTLLKAILRENMRRSRELRRRKVKTMNFNQGEGGRSDGEVADQLRALGYFDWEDEKSGQPEGMDGNKGALQR